MKPKRKLWFRVVLHFVALRSCSFESSRTSGDAVPGVKERDSLSVSDFGRAPTFLEFAHMLLLFWAVHQHFPFDVRSPSPRLV